MCRAAVFLQFPYMYQRIIFYVTHVLDQIIF
jgi:hypothetical protein